MYCIHYVTHTEIFLQIAYELEFHNYEDHIHRFVALPYSHTITSKQRFLIQRLYNSKNLYFLQPMQCALSQQMDRKYRKHCPVCNYK